LKSLNDSYFFRIIIVLIFVKEINVILLFIKLILRETMWIVNYT